MAKIKLDEAKASLSRLKQHLSKPKQIESTVAFLFSSRSGDEKEKWKQIKMVKGLQSSFQSSLVETLFRQLGNKEVVSYTFEGMLNHNIGFWAKEDIEENAIWPYEVPPPNWQFSLADDEKFLAKAKMLVSVIQITANKSAIVFKSHSSNTLMHQDQFKAIFDPTENLFREVPGKVFQFDHRADFIEWEGSIFVLNYTKFESLTHIRTATRNKARKAFNSLNKINNLEIENFDQIRAQILDKVLLSKRLATAESQGIVGHIDIERLEASIERLGLDVPIENDDGKIRFVPDPANKSHLTQIVNLIADYYARGMSTSNIYEVDLKRLRKQ